MGRKKKEKEVPEKQFIFTTDSVNEVIAKQVQGYSLPPYMNPWFKKEPGVRRRGCIFGWTDEELDEYTKCALDIHYFANTYCHIKSEDGRVLQMKLRDYQYKVLDAYSKNRFTINMSSRQTGKDQPLDAKLWTDSGPITMGDVCIGDKIFGADGKLTNVKGIYPQGKRDVYEVTFSDGSKVRCGNEHLWGIETVNGNYAVKQLNEIKDSYLTGRGDYKYFVKACEPVQYSAKNLPVDPYLVGVLLGDGGLSQTSINVASIDNEIIDELKKLADSEDCILTRADHNSFRFTRKDPSVPNKLKYKLTQLGMMGKHSYTKSIPVEYKYSSIEQRLALLQGLMDTDGSVSKKSVIEFSTSSQVLADDITELAESLGIIVRRSEKKTSYKKNNIKHDCRIAYRLKLQLRNDYQYNIFRLTRKQSLVRNKKYDWGRRRGIANIEFIGKQNTQCIEVDNDDHLYLTNHYIPTHNTVCAAITLLHYCIFNTNKNIMVVANKGETVIEILDKIKNIYKLLPFFMKPGIVNWNTKAIIFDNGCRIKSQARSKEPAIGFTIDFLYIDEFAHIPRNIINHYYKAVIPTVSSIKDSKVVITSTPNGANLFKDLVMGAMLPVGHPDKNQYNLIKVLWHQVPEGKFDDGTNGTRFDAKLYPLHFEMQSQGYTIDKLINDLKGLNFKVAKEQETTDTGTKDYIRVLHKDQVSDIDTIRNIDLSENLNIAKICTITNWREQEIKLIGGEENFNQEYNLQFIAGSKRVLSSTKAKDLESRTQVYQNKEIEILSKRLRFSYNELRWAPDYIESERNNYYWVSALDISEGLGQDDSVMNFFRLMVRPKEWLIENKIKTMYDAFYLKQTGIYNFNRLDPKHELPELFYLLHFQYLDPNRVKSVVEYNGPGSTFLGALPHVFDSNNDYGNYIITRYKHRQDENTKRLGLKISRNKKGLVKAYIDCIESDKIYVDENMTLDQMDNFIKMDTPSGDVTYKADSGHDDITMTLVSGATFFDTQDYRNMCFNYYNELPGEFQSLIDKALDLEHNPDAISYKNLSAALAKNRKNIARSNRYSGGTGKYNRK